jgi:hypothetical protein
MAPQLMILQVARGQATAHVDSSCTTRPIQFAPHANSITTCNMNSGREISAREEQDWDAPGDQREGRV